MWPGTNGKGSVCTFIAAILEAAGYKVGRYISPTLYDYRERIQMNGVYIEPEALAEGMSVIREVCEGMAADGMEVPTVFEVETALGFWYFKKNGCDFVVLETGMGGAAGFHQCGGSSDTVGDHFHLDGPYGSGLKYTCAIAFEKRVY